MSIALGGCLRGSDVQYGITEDTGGHIAYVLGEMEALSRRDDVARAEIVTRLIDEPWLDPVHAQPHEPVNEKLFVTRVDSGNRSYLSKEALAADRKAFVDALLDNLRRRKALPDVIHAHFSDAADVAAAVKERFGIPFIYTAHSLGLDKQAANGGKACAGLRARIAEEDRAIASADAIIGSSRDECERQLPAYPSCEHGKVHRIRPGAAAPSTDKSKPASARKLIAPFLEEPDKPIILAIARPVRKKNLETLVATYRDDRELQDRANLVILAGQRDEATELEPEQREVVRNLLREADNERLQGKLALPARHSRSEAEGLFALAAQSGGVFVNPALVEPYGLTLIEAASYGLPVVATNRGGPIDIVGELQHGALTNPTDNRAMALAIKRLLTNRDEWRVASTNGRTRIRSMTWEHYAERLIGVCCELARSDVDAGKTQPSQLLLCDMDHTLTGCDRGIRRFRRFRERRPDIAFGIATGRSISEARRVAQEWRLPMPDVWASSVGTEIYWQTADGLRADADFEASIADGWRPDAIDRVLANVAGLAPQALYEQRAFKRSYIVQDDSIAEEVRDTLDGAGIAARVVFSHRELLDVLPVKAGKAAAMRHIAERLRLSPPDVFAVGDSGNDADMLAACRNAIIVGNFSNELLRLTGLENVYVARRHHANGALEGLLAHRARLRKRQTDVTA